MLSTSILPSPNLEPYTYTEWALQNPLLLAKHPQKLAATKAAFEAGKYVGPRLHELAVWLYTTRADLRRHTPVAENKLSQQKWFALIESRDMLDNRVFTQQERGNLRMQFMLAHGTELDWLGKPLIAEYERRMLLHVEAHGIQISDPPTTLPLPF